MSNPISNNIQVKLTELYISGLSATKTAEILGVSESTVRNYLKKYNIGIRTSSYYNRIYSRDVIEQLRELYKDGLSSKDIEQKTGIKAKTVIYLLKKEGLNLRHRGPKSLIKREDYFDIIDDEYKAYYLGWLMADGNVSIYNGQYSLKIHIALKDRELIDGFLREIQSTNKTIIKEKKYKSYYVSLTSVHMCKTLISLGVIPNKTSKEYIPKLDKKYIRHFIRGFFDGDGITDISKKRSGFVGGKTIIEELLRVLEENKIKIFKTKKGDNIYYFLGGKGFSKRLYEYIYKDSNVYLKRKKLRMEYICFK